MMDYQFAKAREAWADIHKGRYEEGTKFPPNQTSAGEDPKDPPVIAELHQLQNNLQTLDEYIGSLESKLNMILRLEPEKELAHVFNEPRGTSPILNALYEANNMVHRMRGRLVYIQDRLEV
jgi:hypothetical protein